MDDEAAKGSDRQSGAITRLVARSTDGAEMSIYRGRIVLVAPCYPVKNRIDRV